MKRYIVHRNDEDIHYHPYGKSFNQLKDARNFQQTERMNYISKYFQIYDTKKKEYV